MTRRATTAATAAAAQAALASLAEPPSNATTPAVLMPPPDPEGSAPVDQALRRIPFLQIHPSHLNPRRTFDEQPIRELADSIAQQGLLQNLVVRRDPEQPIYWIVAGERRWRALELLAREDRWPAELTAGGGVPCRVIDATDAEHLAIALLENLQRQDVNAMEEAEAFAKLQKLDPEKWRPSAIAEKIGTSVRHVQQRLALVTRLAPEAQQALRDGAITFTHARELLLAPPKRQVELVESGIEYTAKSLRDVVGRGLIPEEHARFDLARLPAEAVVLDEETGKRFINDRDRFLKLQKEAVKELAAELRKARWAFVTIESYETDWKYERCEDRSRAGVVIVFEEYSGRVTVHKNRAPKNHSPLPEERAAHQARVALLERKEKAAERWKADLAAALVASDDMTVVVSLLLLDRLQAKQYGSDRAVLTYGGDAGLPAALFRSLGALAPLGPNSEDAEKGRKRIKDEIPGDQILLDLLDLAPERLITAFTTWVASRLRIYPQDAPHPALVNLSERYGVTVPRVLMGLDDEAAPPQMDIEDAINRHASDSE